MDRYYRLYQNLGHIDFSLHNHVFDDIMHMQTTNSEMNLILYRFWSEDVDFINNLGLEISYCQHYKHPLKTI